MNKGVSSMSEPESTLRSTVDLPYGVHALWSILPDLHNYDQWMSIHREFVGDVPGIQDMKEGTTFSEVVTLMGVSNTIEWTVLQFTGLDEVLAGREGAFTIRGSGMAGVDATIVSRVEQIDEHNTRVTVDSSFTGQMFTGPLGAVLDKVVQQELDNSVARLKEFLASEIG